MKQLYIYIILLVAGTQSLLAQKIVDGYIYDADYKNPLKGVTVKGKLTNRSAQTDYKGNFRFIIPEKADILIISLPGYAKKEVNIHGLSHIEIGLRSYASIQVEGIVVIGSRDRTRTKGETYVAVDIIPVKEIVNESGYVELTQILHYFAPSFNANRQSGADLADHIDPVSLRGLGPDQVLFLINGKRVVRSSIINVFGTRGRGNVNTDINSIPASAIERIEVLRDGAAAQYGSDAIAGVVNIVLKDDKGSTSGSVSYGTYATGYGKSLNYGDYGKILPKIVDGGTFNANVTHSFDVEKGSLTVTADFLKKAHTYRPNNTDAFPDKNYRDNFGDHQQTATGYYFNGSYPFRIFEGYAFGGYQYRQTESNIWTISSDDSTRNVYQIYPNGYNPKLLSELHNTNFTIGARNQIKGWNNDFSINTGLNYVDLHTKNTLNPSLLLKSKTAFHNGSYRNAQNIISFETNKKFKEILRGLNIALGAEFRQDYYSIMAGEDASWKNYMPNPLIIPLANGAKDTIIKVGTSQGYPGISPHDALNANRRNLNIYSDVEIEITPKLLVAGAMRYEKYFNYDGALGGKLALRYKILKHLSARFSSQTGFRVPSLAQIYFQSTINDVDENGTNFEKIIANNKSILAKKLGIPDLKAEKSLNTGFGLSYNPNEKLSISADAYLIDVHDRIVLSDIFDTDNEIIGKDLAAMNVRQTQFYINALNTRTTGLDINASYMFNIGSQKINMILGGNFNKMLEKQTIDTPKLLGSRLRANFNERELLYILGSAPRAKFHYTLNYQFEKIGFNLNMTYFSKVETLPYSQVNTTPLIFQPLMVTDLSFSYKLNKKISFILGANNLFDVYPSIQDPSITEGGGQWESVQNGFNGAFFFTKLALKF